MNINVRYLYLLIFLVFWQESPAQNLPRRGSLGIEYVQAPDSLFKALHTLETRGLWIKSVMPNSTAHALGLQPNDVLVAVNETDSLYDFDFQMLERQLVTKEPISVTFLRGRRKSRVVGFVAPAPLEKSNYGEVLYGEVPFNRQWLRTIVHRPSGHQRYPAVMLIQDYACQSIDFSKDTLNPLKQLVDGWVKAGFVVVRIERSGVGESTPGKECTRLTWAEDMQIFESAYDYTRSLLYVDGSRVFLFGKGLGGSIAPLLSAKAKEKPKGIMVFGAVVKPWFEHMLETTRKRPLLLRDSYQSIEANVRMLTPLLYEWLVNVQTATDLMESPDFEAILTSKENPLRYNRGTIMGRAVGYFPELNRQNLPQAWAQAGVPTLALHGEYDLETLTPETARTIVDIVNEVSPNRATFKMLPNTNQFLLKSNEFSEQPNSNIFNPEIVNVTVEWMRKQ